MEREANVPVSLDELETYEEAATVNPDANFGDQAPPPYEFEPMVVGGKVVPGEKILHLVIPTMTVDQEHKLPTKTNKNGKLQFVGIDWKVRAQGKPWDGFSMRNWPSVQVNRAQTTEVDSILKAYFPVEYKRDRLYALPEGKKMRLVAEQFAAQKPLRVEVEWEASVETVDQEGKKIYPNVPGYRGMKNYPHNILEDGVTVVYEALDVAPVGGAKGEFDAGADCRTNVRIKAYHPA